MLEENIVRIPLPLRRQANNGSLLLHGLKPLEGLIHTIAVTRLFATEGIGDDAGVVAGAVVHTLYAVEILSEQLRIIRWSAADGAIGAL